LNVCSDTLCLLSRTAAGRLRELSVGWVDPWVGLGLL